MHGNAGRRTIASTKEKEAKRPRQRAHHLPLGAGWRTREAACWMPGGSGGLGQRSLGGRLLAGGCRGRSQSKAAGIGDGRPCCSFALGSLRSAAGGGDLFIGARRSDPVLPRLTDARTPRRRTYEAGLLALSCHERVVEPEQGKGVGRPAGRRRKWWLMMRPGWRGG
jgi:hypothetical protein